MSSDEEPQVAGLQQQIDEVGRRTERRFEPGGRAVFIAVAVLVLLLSAALPWAAGTSGWNVLLGSSTGERVSGFAPRLFLFVALLAGVLGSVLALGLRRYLAAWLCSLGCDASVLLGALSVWSQQTTGGQQPGPGPEAGMVLAMVAVLGLAVLWSSIAWGKPRENS